jgi:Tol biopolymer transport system component
MDYLTDGNFSPARRVTSNTYADTLPALSPDGKGKIVFEQSVASVIGAGQHLRPVPEEP